MEALVEGIEAPPVATKRPWRLRHPAVARGILYGAAVALGTAGYAYAAHCREEARQSGLVTVIHGVETAVRAADPRRLSGSSAKTSSRRTRTTTSGAGPSSRRRLRSTPS